MNRGEPHLARRGRRGLVELDLAPLHAPVGSPLQVQFDYGARGLVGCAIDPGDRGPALRIGRAIHGIFGFSTGDVAQFLNLSVWNVSGHRVPRLILPEHAYQRAAAWHANVVRLADRLKVVVISAAHRERFLEPPIQSLAMVVRNHHTGSLHWPASRLERKLRANLIAWRYRLPAIGQLICRAGQ